MTSNRFLWALSLLLSIGLLSACGKKNEEVVIVEEKDSNHTLLIYMIGDNNLSGYCSQNTNNSIIGLLNSPHPLNLVIYEDSNVSGDGRKGTPVLFSLKRNAVDKNRVDTTYLKRYDEDWNSASIDVMQQVINETFAQYNTEVKGLELWSHALGWVPSDAFTLSRPAVSDDFDAETRATQWVGMDRSNEMDIWQLREALEQCPHLDYVVYDCCNMGQAEVAYELKSVADYMLACPTEIMAAGLPYDKMIFSLSTCQDKQSLLPALRLVVDDFAALYDGAKSYSEGTFALTDLRQMQAVHDAYLSLRDSYPERLELLSERFYIYEDNITHYGRGSMGTKYYFYDLLDAARFYVGADTLGSSFTTFKEILSKAVVKEYHTQSFLEISDIRSCGLGVALPEGFRVSTNKKTLTEGYSHLLWSQP